LRASTAIANCRTKVASADTNGNGVFSGTCYAVKLSSDTNLSDIAAGARIATSGNLASKTVALGSFNAANLAPAFASAGPNGQVCQAFAAYKDTGVAATSRLLFFVDKATGLPITLNTADVNITWDTGVNKIAKL